MIIDTNRNTYGRAAALKAAGVTDVIRYIAAGLVSNEKVVKPAEAKYLADNGIRLGLVYEISGRPSGAAVGNRDGMFALAYAKTVGAPRGAVIWNTVDYDASAGDYPGVSAAFRAFHSALDGYYRLGTYSSGYIADRLARDGLIDDVSTDAPMDTMGGAPLIWITDSVGFAGSRSSIAGGRYIIRQLLPRNTAGLDTDPDVLNPAIQTRGDMAHLGTFIPWTTPDGTVTPPPDPLTVVGSIEWTQDQLNKKAAAGLDVDGVEGPFTLKAIETFQRAYGLLVDGQVGPQTIGALQALA